MTHLVPIRLPLVLILIAGHAPVEATPMTISGVPAPTVVVGTQYDFLPTVENADFSLLEFNYINKPAWSTSYRGSGLIRGTPMQPGIYPDIQIGAWDGRHYAQLAPFTITVTAAGVALLTWIQPHFNTDGTPLTDLAGYLVRYGRVVTALDQRLTIGSPLDHGGHPRKSARRRLVLRHRGGERGIREERLLVGGGGRHTLIQPAGGGSAPAGPGACDLGPEWSFL